MLSRSEAQIEKRMEGRMTDHDFDRVAVELAVTALYDAIDAKDWRQCEGLLGDQLRVDFGELSGSSEPLEVGRADLLAAWSNGLHEGKLTQHMHTNHLVRVDGDEASLACKVYAINRLPRQRGSATWEVWGTYRHRLLRTEDRWRCVEISVTVSHARGNEMVRDDVRE